MAKLVMCQGLPGSGKSTWAATQEAVDVNKDAIRAQLKEDAGWEWSREGEKMVVEIRDAKIRLALAAGKNVISSDTNFGGGHEARLRELAAEAGADFEVKKFLVSVEECCRRDELRDHPVGSRVIEGMAVANKEFNIRDTPPPVSRIEGLPDAIICDLDGTLADFKTPGHRGPYDKTGYINDALVVPIFNLVTTYFRKGYEIIYLSGREDFARDETERWLNANFCPVGQLLMRRTGDSRKDSIVKREIFDAIIRGKWNVEFVLDDRDQVVRMWRELGLTCLQVADGNF